MSAEIIKQHSFGIGGRNEFVPNGTVNVVVSDTMLAKATAGKKNSKYTVVQFVFETGLELVKLGSDVPPKLQIPKSDQGGSAPSMIDKNGKKVHNPYLSDHSPLRLSTEDQIIFSVVEHEFALAKEAGVISTESAIQLTISKRKKPCMGIVGAGEREVFGIFEQVKRRLAKIEHGGVPLSRGDINLSEVKITSNAR